MIYVNREGWDRRGVRVHHFWADSEPEMHQWAAALGFTDFYPSAPGASYRVFRHYLLTADQMALAEACGAKVTDRWAITAFVAMRTLMTETDEAMVRWAAGLLDKLTQAGHC